MMLLIASRHVKYVSHDCTPLVSIFLAGALLPFVCLSCPTQTSPVLSKPLSFQYIFSPPRSSARCKAKNENSSSCWREMFLINKNEVR